MLKKLKQKIRNAFVAFSFGLKNTETDIFGQKTNVSGADNSITQKQKMNELADALLKGEVTEQVEMLRDRTYLVSEESKKYKVFINTVGTSKAMKKMGVVNVPKVFNEENYSIDIVMDNNAIPTGVLTALESVDGYGIPNEYPLKFEYSEDYTPKFKIQEYVKKLVVRSDQTMETTKVDLYVPIHTDSFERLSKIFDNEINKVKDGRMKPFNLEFDSVEFISDKAYGTDDLRPYKFKMIKLLYISEFDGNNILTYEVEPIGEHEKITEKYKNKKLRDGYKNKDKRNSTLNLGGDTSEKHVCDACGGDMESEYDYRITKETIGKGLCKECLEKHNKKKQ